jgi:hypothetical protein
MKESELELTQYQRGNRDGLESFAVWAEQMEKELKEEANRLELKACESGILARDNVRTSITGLRYKANAFQHAANKARQMSQSLPIDPLCEEE